MDYMEKSKQDRGILETIALYVPGYRGYREKNIRREIDRLVRSHVGLSIKEAKTVLNDTKRQVLENGDIQSAKSMERISVKIDTYMKSIESAESGYSGIWETMKTTDSDLDEIVEWDQKLVLGSKDLKEVLKALRDKADAGDSDLKNDVRDVERLVDDLQDGLNQRKLVLKGLSESAPSEAPETIPEETVEQEEEEKPKRRGFFRRK